MNDFLFWELTFGRHVICAIVKTYFQWKFTPPRYLKYRNLLCHYQIPTVHTHIKHSYIFVYQIMHLFAGLFVYRYLSHNLRLLCGLCANIKAEFGYLLCLGSARTHPSCYQGRKAAGTKAVWSFWVANGLQHGMSVHCFCYTFSTKLAVIVHRLAKCLYICYVYIIFLYKLKFTAFLNLLYDYSNCLVDSNNCLYSTGILCCRCLRRRGWSNLWSRGYWGDVDCCAVV